MEKVLAIQMICILLHLASSLIIIKGEVVVLEMIGKEVIIITIEMEMILLITQIHQATNHDMMSIEVENIHQKESIMIRGMNMESLIDEIGNM